MSRSTLAQQIADLDDTAPPDFDPEDDHLNSHVDHDDDASLNEPQPKAGREHYIEVGQSAIRKQIDRIDDPRYEGTRVSRQQLLDQESVSEVEDADDDEDTDLSDGNDTRHEDLGFVHPTHLTDSDESYEEEMSDPIPTAQEPESQQTQSTQDSREQDRRKGKAVTRQQVLWDSLLDCRIRLQKSVVDANRLPKANMLQRLAQSDSGKQSIQSFLQESLELSGEISELEHALMVSNENLQPPPLKKRRIALAEDTYPWEEHLKESDWHRSAVEQIFHPHLLRTLHKWSAKVNAVAPSALSSSRNAFRPRTAQQHLKSVVDLVDDLLRDDKAIGRTRVLRNQISKIGGEHEQSPLELFDDTDFYHQLLRDVVESKSGRNGITEQIAARLPKVKKKVDTKASKGRKIRYNVHEKLQNFMVPIPVARWHEEQIDELFGSLLGRGFEQVGGDDTKSARIHVVGAAENGSTLKDGFRIFA